MPAWEAFEAEQPLPRIYLSSPISCRSKGEIMSHRIAARISSFVFCVAALCAMPKSPAQTPANAPSAPSNSASAQEKPARVTTTVVVHGEVKDDYLPESVTVGTLDSATLQQTPLSATVITRDLLTDQVARYSRMWSTTTPPSLTITCPWLLRLLPDSRLSSRPRHRP